jgi:hypothetical protein
LLHCAPELVHIIRENLGEAREKSCGALLNISSLSENQVRFFYFEFQNYVSGV